MACMLSLATPCGILSERILKCKPRPPRRPMGVDRMLNTMADGSGESSGRAHLGPTVTSVRRFRLDPFRVLLLLVLGLDSRPLQGAADAPWKKGLDELSEMRDCLSASLEAAQRSLRARVLAERPDLLSVLDP